VSVLLPILELGGIREALLRFYEVVPPFLDALLLPSQLGPVNFVGVVLPAERAIRLPDRSGVEGAVVVQVQNFVGVPLAIQTRV